MSRAILVVGAGGPRTRTSWDQILAGPILRSLKSEIDSASAESRVLGSPLARTSARSRFTPPLHPDHKMVLVMDGEASTSAHVGGPQLSTSPRGEANSPHPLLVSHARLLCRGEHFHLGNSKKWSLTIWTQHCALRYVYRKETKTWPHKNLYTNIPSSII